MRCRQTLRCPDPGPVQEIQSPSRTSKSSSTRRTFRDARRPFDQHIDLHAQPQVVNGHSKADSVNVPGRLRMARINRTKHSIVTKEYKGETTSGPSQGIKQQQRNLSASHLHQHTEAATAMHTNNKRAIETLSTPPHVGNTGTSSPAS